MNKLNDKSMLDAAEARIAHLERTLERNEMRIKELEAALSRANSNAAWEREFLTNQLSAAQYGEWQ